MNGKRIWLILPAALLPYLALISMAVIFYSTEIPICRYLLETVFRDNGLNLILALFAYCMVAAVLSCICFAVSIYQSWDPLSLAKTAMLVKLLQIPAYGLIFLMGVMFMITLFTIPFAIGLLLLDCLSVFLSGLITISAVSNAARQGLMPYRRSLWVILLQFIFCADVIAATVFYFKLKKHRG